MSDRFVPRPHEAARATLVAHGARGEAACVEPACAAHSVDAATRFADSIRVGALVRLPRRHYRNNVAPTPTLLEAIIGSRRRKTGVASRAAIFGERACLPIAAKSRGAPLSTRRPSKDIVDRLVADVWVVRGAGSVGLHHIDTTGSVPGGSHGESREHGAHLMPPARQTASRRMAKAVPRAESSGAYAAAREVRSPPRAKSVVPATRRVPSPPRTRPGGRWNGRGTMRTSTSSSPMPRSGNSPSAAGPAADRTEAT